MLRQVVPPILLLCMASVAWGQFKNGQPAAFVLGQSNFTNQESSPISSHYFGAQDIAIDARSGKAFVIDKYAHRILRYANVDTLALGASPSAPRPRPCSARVT